MAKLSQGEIIERYARAEELTNQAASMIGRAVSLLRSSGKDVQANVLDLSYLRLIAARDFVHQGLSEVDSEVS